jgi:NAD(P)-dependent dehydrogenase (short-subunit alcohol dehydrogenase family)
MTKGDRKLAVVTGTTRGLGRAMALEFARQGWTVAGCGRSAGLVQSLGVAMGPPHQHSVVDVAEDAQVSAWARGVISDVGLPDLLINNAALMNPSAPLWKICAHDFDAVIDVNLKGVANVIRHFVPAMIERGRGIIVNFSSGWGRSTDADVAPYCCTKWGIEGLTQALAQELPRGLAAIPLNPGIIDTDMLRSCFGGSAGSYPDPTEWARTAVPFLIALEPRHNGKSLTVNQSAG